jgi:hypothetical protein
MTKVSLGWECVLQAIELAQTEARRLRVDASQLAESKRATASLEGDYTAARIWRDVWVSLMTQKYLPASLRMNELTTAEKSRLEGSTKH